MPTITLYINSSSRGTLHNLHNQSMLQSVKIRYHQYIQIILYTKEYNLKVFRSVHRWASGQDSTGLMPKHKTVKKLFGMSVCSRLGNLITGFCTISNDENFVLWPLIGIFSQNQTSACHYIGNGSAQTLLFYLFLKFAYSSMGLFILLLSNSSQRLVIISQSNSCYGIKCKLLWEWFLW